MDYEFFNSLTAEQATAYLNRFLDVERQSIEELRTAAATEGIRLDYSMSSLPNVLKWMVKKVRVERAPVPEDEPWWIRQAHKKGLTEFAEDSKTLLLRAGYYMGECFARLPGLGWTTGDPEYMERHMPVIAGFRGGQEFPPLVVVENIFARIVGDGHSSDEIDETLAAWLRDCPEI